MARKGNLYLQLLSFSNIKLINTVSRILFHLFPSTCLINNLANFLWVTAKSRSDLEISSTYVMLDKIADGRPTKTWRSQTKRKEFRAMMKNRLVLTPCAPPSDGALFAIFFYYISAFP